MRVGIIGAGWAGLSAAITARRQGCEVRVFESAPQTGGRARRVVRETPWGLLPLDNGQHMLVGAYQETLQLLKGLGMSPERLVRQKFHWVNTQGARFITPPLPAPLDAIAALTSGCNWPWQERWALISASLRSRYTVAAPGQTVGELLRDWRQPPAMIEKFWAPLCLSAMNTHPEEACARTFLNVLKATLAKGGRSADFLLPRQDLSTLLPDLAEAYFRNAPVDLHLQCTIAQIARQNATWNLISSKGECFQAERVIVATPHGHAGKLLESMPRMSDSSSAKSVEIAIAGLQSLSYRAITTLWVLTDTPPPTDQSHRVWILPQEAANHPQVWIPRRVPLGNRDYGLHAFVLSADEIQGSDDAALAKAHGVDERRLREKIVANLLESLSPKSKILQQWMFRDPRATFACTPRRYQAPSALVPRTGLFLAGDYVESPYPATLEAAVRSGIRAGQLAARA